MILYVGYLLSFIWIHPYISSFVIVVLFILGAIIYIVQCLIIPIQNWLARRKRERQLDIIEQTVLNISERLSRGEERQADGVQSVQFSIALLAEELRQLRTIVHSSTETICTLRNEVHDLTTTLDEVHLMNVALTDEMKQLKARVIDIHSSNGNIATIRDDVQQLNTLMSAVCATPKDEEQQIKDIVSEVYSSNGSIMNEVRQLKATVNEVHSSSGSIATLTDEVLELKATVNEVHSNSRSNAMITDEVQQLKVKLNEMHSINATLTELMQQLKVTATPLQEAAGSTVNQVPLDKVSSSQSYSTKQPSLEQCSRDDIPVSGERIVWGTYSSTIEKKVEETITRLTSLSASDFTIAKKYSDSVSQRWWFVIAAEESVLLKLQEEWHSVKAHTRWKLKKTPTDQASNYV